MKLKNLLAGIPILDASADMEQDIQTVVYDSRKVTPGALFVAISGFAVDGNRFITSALEKGACAVVTAKRPEEEIPYVLVENDRLALAQIGCHYFDHPAEAMTMVGITGTNGKTSTTLLLKHILESTGAKVGLIGTMQNMIGDEILPTERTTPESFELQSLFARMRERGCTHVVMEVSSHAIALERIAGFRFNVAAFTNLSEDHLDFHKTMENYCDTKALLFERCERCVANIDDPWFSRMIAKANGNVFSFSSQKQADLYAQSIELNSDSVSFTAVSQEEETRIRLPIPGAFTVSNALTALAVAHQLGISLENSAAALACAQGIKGRVEVVPTPGKDYTVLIDYAHTPDGLENVLTSVKDFCKGKLIAVFGCGGDRDRTKRPIMGHIGTTIADFSVITSDNPRTEAPAAIIRDILDGVSAEPKTYTVIEDRRKAIQYAMDKAQKNDIIVLAGKGHETYQEICGIKYPMDEREIVAAYLTEKRT